MTSRLSRAASSSVGHFTCKQRGDYVE